MQTKKKIDYLLLKTADQRCFFTHKSNFPQLIEFAKACEAEISVVKTTEKIDILGLEELAKSICDCNKVTSVPPYEVVEVKISPYDIKVKLTREERIRRAKEINDFIKNELLSGKEICVSDLEKKFDNYKLKKASLCNHMTKARLELAYQGYHIDKPSPGQYVIKVNKK